MQSATERPLKVCVVVTYDIAEQGGVKHHAYEVASALRRRGDDVSIIGPTSAPVGGEGVTGFSGVARFQANGSNNAFGIFINPVRLRQYFARKQFDVIHVHEPLNPVMGYYSAWLTPRTPHVATFHAFGEKEPLGLKIARGVMAPLSRPFYQRAIAVSEPARRWAGPSWKKPLTIIPNGVSIKAFRPGTRRHDGEGPLRLLFVGKLVDARKGYRFLAEAYGRLLGRGVSLEMDVAGDAGNGEGLPRLPGITYHGSVSFEKLVELYRGCDVFVAPSTGQESFGMVLLEAMATARPIICSAIEGYRQVADEQGARLVPPCDPGAIEQAILELHADPLLRFRMGAYNRTRAEAYDWELITARVRSEYLAAIDERRVAEGRVLPAPVAPLRLPPAPAPERAVDSDAAAELARRQAGNA